MEIFVLKSLDVGKLNLIQEWKMDAMMHREGLKEVPHTHATLKQCWFNVEPPSTTSAQHQPNISSKSRVCWVAITENGKGLPPAA